MRPLSCEEPCSPTGPDLALDSAPRRVPAPDALPPHGGMVLKLRRMGGPDPRSARYRPVCDPRLDPGAGSSTRSPLKIKYCPFLSACHSADRRRKWVLRSAVCRARRALRWYPDLVGKRIRHLYEEEDGTEAWYRGQVVRVHEAHRNPLKTVYEVRYDSEPEWTYYLELLKDFRKGWIQVED